MSMICECGRGFAVYFDNRWMCAYCFEKYSRETIMLNRAEKKRKHQAGVKRFWKKIYQSVIEAVSKALGQEYKRKEKDKGEPEIPKA